MYPELVSPDPDSALQVIPDADPDPIIKLGKISKSQFLNAIVGTV